MKKQYKMIAVCIAIITVLLVRAAFYFVKEYEIDSSESAVIHVEAEAEEKIELSGIKTVVSPDEMASIIALDEAGYVWEWEEGKAKENAVLIAELEGVVQIVDTGCGSVYALTEEGNVYAWGMNLGWLIDPKQETDVVFPEPVRLENLSDITKIEAANGQAFAIDREGRLFVWGLGRYKYNAPDYIPSLVEGFEERTNNVEEIYMGAGGFHYFKRKDNQIFSILTSEHLTDDLCYFIVPNFAGEPSVSDWLSDIREGKSERIFDIRVEGGPCLVYLYEMGKKEDIALISADGYTMYLYQKDGTLWYWNSDIITYHDKERAGASVELRDLDYRGAFEEIDVRKILDMEKESMAIPQIISISPGINGALFLLENGEVFASEYVTTEIKDVEYFARNHDNPQNTWTAVAYDLPLKGLSFRKLDYENIVSISSNKDDKFYLVDKLGNIYCYQIEMESDDFASGKTDTLCYVEEFSLFKGEWVVGEYLDSIVESTGVDVDTEEYKESHEKWVLELKEKYEGYSFEISEDSIEYFGASNEIGYYFEDYGDLFFVFRQPPGIEIVPPFVCASVRLKGLDEGFDIIIDGNGDAILEVEYGFFELDREAE